MGRKHTSPFSGSLGLRSSSDKFIDHVYLFIWPALVVGGSISSPGKQTPSRDPLTAACANLIGPASSYVLPPFANCELGPASNETFCDFRRVQIQKLSNHLLGAMLSVKIIPAPLWSWQNMLKLVKYPSIPRQQNWMTQCSYRVRRLFLNGPTNDYDFVSLDWSDSSFRFKINSCALSEFYFYRTSCKWVTSRKLNDAHRLT